MTGQWEALVVVLARVERTVTGDVVLHLMSPSSGVEISEGAEYLTVGLRVNPWESADFDSRGPS